MTSYGTTICVLLALASTAQAREIARDYFATKIVNGQDVKIGEIPYQVSLQRTGNANHFCGGVILNKDYIVTAAHCVSSKNARDIIAGAGMIDLRTPGQVTKIEKIIVHEKYNPGDSWVNDIALLKVVTPFKKNENVSFVSLTKPEDAILSAQPAVVSGWGRLSMGGSTTYILKRANLQIADSAYCSAAYSEFGLSIYPTHVCADAGQEERGSCHGDSGGPLTVEGKLAGLVSWAKECAKPGFPTVYTRVSEYQEWIATHAV
ncbi:trypsin-1-like [Orussus abietinus]|uniref:trypsin-1-like n=1 Tax=Orussus abietinus TaxID=222816 RepID=UPI000624FA8F|nr:trypsin-1-like [Orussus abietinus]